MDVVGKEDDIASLDGISAPRISGDKLAAKNYTNAQKGALIYVTEPVTFFTNIQVANVNSIGYYYFDGTIWVALKTSIPTSYITHSLTRNGANELYATINSVNSNPLDIVSSVSNSIDNTSNSLVTNVNGVSATSVTIPNIYTNDGNLLDDRIITEGSKTLTFTGTSKGTTKFINSNGTSSSPLSAVQIQDGGQNTGKYLMSDDTGNATWGRVNMAAVSGSFSNLVTGTSSANDMVYTGATITLPKGKWMIHLGSTVVATVNPDYSNPSSLDAYSVTQGSIWVTFTIADTSTVPPIGFLYSDGSTYASGADIWTRNDHIVNYSGFRAAAGVISVGSYITFVNGSFAVNNTLDSKTYYIWMREQKTSGNIGTERPSVLPDNLHVYSAFSSGSWERYLYAIPIQ